MVDLKVIMKLAGGNPEAAIFAGDILSNVDNLFNTLIDLDIVDTNAYVLWSDICSKDLMLVYLLVLNCDTKVLQDASNIQDYSGKDLPEIKKIVDAYNTFLVDIQK